MATDALGTQDAGRFRISARTALIVVYVAGMAMGSLDSTVVNVTLPSVSADLHATSTSISAVSVAYLVGYAVSIPVSSWISERLGAHRVLLGAVAGFTAASILCGLCRNLGELTGARAVQGLSGGMMVPVGLAMLFRVVPPGDRIKLAGILTIPPSLAQAAGPVVGGVLNAALDWRWVFFINGPIGIALVAFGLRHLRDDGHRSDAQLDAVGLALASLGLSATLYGVSTGPRAGWSAATTVATLGGGLVLLAALVWWELHTAHPLLDIRLWRDRLFGVATTVQFLAMMCLTSWLFVIAQYLQLSRGLSSIQAGTATLPQTLGVVFGAQLTSRVLYRRFGPRRTSMLGFGLITVALAIEAVLVVTGPQWLLLVVLFVSGASTPLAFQATQAAGYATIATVDMSRASALNNSMRQVGGALGVALVATVMSLAVGAGGRHGAITDPHAYQAALVALGCLSLLAVTVAARIDDQAASATLVRAPLEDPQPA